MSEKTRSRQAQTPVPPHDRSTPSMLIRRQICLGPRCLNTCEAPFQTCTEHTDDLERVALVLL